MSFFIITASTCKYRKSLPKWRRIYNKYYEKKITSMLLQKP